MQKILVSGIKPTGRFHFGNYFGAMRQNINLSNSPEYDSYIFLADYHALTTMHTKERAEQLKAYTLESAAAYIACGLDPKKLFKQSSVPEHAELATILNNLVTMPYMMRAHAFKDHEAKSKDVNLGLFTYPVLMAADILIYNADIVPVGADQKQHTEYARDIAGYFNRSYACEAFRLPSEYIVKEVALIPGIDGEKMSKSRENHIELFCDEIKLKSLILSIVTDSAKPEDKKDPDTNNIYNIHKHFLSKEADLALREKFMAGGYSYKDAKEDLCSTIIDWRKGKIEIFNALLDNPEKINSILQAGGDRARAQAKNKIKEIRKIVGLE